MLTLTKESDTCAKMEVPFSLGTDKHVPRVELRVAFGKGGILGQKQVIGNASVSLTSLPVYASQDEAEAEISKTLPVDIYFSKPKMRHLPMGVSQRKDGNPNVICHARARLWMTVLAQIVDQDVSDDEDDLLDEDEIDEVIHLLSSHPQITFDDLADPGWLSITVVRPSRRLASLSRRTPLITAVPLSRSTKRSRRYQKPSRRHSSGHCVRTR
jgi:hypothetical protein